MLLPDSLRSSVGRDLTPTFRITTNPCPVSGILPLGAIRIARQPAQDQIHLSLGCRLPIRWRHGVTRYRGLRAEARNETAGSRIFHDARRAGARCRGAFAWSGAGQARRARMALPDA